MTLAHWLTTILLLCLSAACFRYARPPHPYFLIAMPLGVGFALPGVERLARALSRDHATHGLLVVLLLAAWVIGLSWPTL